MGLLGKRDQQPANCFRLANAGWSLTEIVKMYEDLLGLANWDADPDNGWRTNNLSLTVGTDGTVHFTGFYGKYIVTVAGHDYLLDLTKGTIDYSLIVGPPSADFDRDGDVDGADLLAWQQGLDGSTDSTFEDGDANYDGVVSDADYDICIAAFGAGESNATAESVPEPSTLLLSAFVMGTLTKRRRGLLA